MKSLLLPCLACAALLPLIPSAHADYTKTPNQSIEAKGVRYAYRTLGPEGGTPLVFLQHWTGTMDNWDSELIDLIAKDRKVIVFNNRGVGSSGGTVPDNVKEMAEDAADFIEALKLEKVDLIGFSLGGFIVQQILIDRPDLVRKAVLAGTGPQGGEGVNQLQPALEAAIARSREKQIPLQVALFFSDSEKGTNAGLEFTKRILNHTVDPETPSGEDIRNTQFKAIIAWGDGEPQTEQLRKVQQPVLIVNGNNDVMVPTINSYHLFQTLSNAHLILYPDSGHGAIFQYRHIFSSQLNVFLNL